VREQPAHLELRRVDNTNKMRRVLPIRTRLQCRHRPHICARRAQHLFSRLSQLERAETQKDIFHTSLAMRTRKRRWPATTLTTCQFSSKKFKSSSRRLAVELALACLCSSAVGLQLSQKTHARRSSSRPMECRECCTFFGLGAATQMSPHPAAHSASASTETSI